MSSLFELIKVVWNNKRYRSLSILLIYIIFFAIIIFMVKISGDNKVEKVLSPMEQFYSQTRYNFNVEINEDSFTGLFEDNKLFIVYNEEEYDQENIDSFTYQEIIQYLDNKNIYELLKDKEPYSKTEYSDNKKCTTYVIDDVELEIYEKDKVYEIDVKINDNEYKIIYI